MTDQDIDTNINEIDKLLADGAKNDTAPIPFEIQSNIEDNNAFGTADRNYPPLPNTAKVSTINNSNNLNVMLNEKEMNDLAQSRIQSLVRAGQAFDRLDVNKDGEIAHSEIMNLAS